MATLMSNEAQAVQEWNAARIEALGVQHAKALEAARCGIDWHEVEDLLRRGCSLTLALRILRPLEERGEKISTQVSK